MSIQMSDNKTVELRRYPSRKLYNRTTSSYIRLSEVADRVRHGATIRVEDTETGEDVTRQVLLQIVVDQEGQASGAILSADLMMDGIRMHQFKASEIMTRLFEQSVAFLRAQQEQLSNRVTGAIAGGMSPPWSIFDPAAIQEMHRVYHNRLVSLWSVAARPSVAPPAGASGHSLSATLTNSGRSEPGSKNGNGASGLSKSAYSRMR